MIRHSFLTASLIALSACGGDSGNDPYEIEPPPEVSAPAAGSPDVASGAASDDAVPGPRGNVPIDDFRLDPEAVAGPYAETVLAAAGGGEAAGAALFVPDTARGLVLYYRVADLPAGSYALRLGRDCSAGGGTALGTVEAGPTGGASGQLLLEALPGPEAADGQVLVVAGAGGRPVACGPISMAGEAAAGAR